MDYEYNDRKQESVYSRRLKAGKRRTYFFDVRETRGNDFFLTITESRKRFNDDGYDRHKIFLYKEDFNKFVKALGEAVDFVKTDLMPDYDFDIFSHEGEDGESLPLIRQVQPKTENTDIVTDTDQDFQPSSHAEADSTPEAGEVTDQDQEDTVAAENEEQSSSLSEIEAEPMHAAVTATESEVNAESTVDKLASEEVEKW